MSKFQKQNLVKVPFHFVSQQKNKEFCGGFWCGVGCTALLKLINWYIALLPNPVGSTVKTSLLRHTILWMHSICSSLRDLWTKLAGEAFKADQNSLSLLASSDVTMEFISSQDFFDRKSHCHTGNQLWLSSKYLLLLDRSEKSPDSGLATDK